jgi:hypothetical protein
MGGSAGTAIAGMQATGGVQASGGTIASGGFSGALGTGDTGGAAGAGGSAASDATGGVGGDAGSLADSGAPPDDGGAPDASVTPPQDLPQALRDAGVVALFPAPGGSDLCPDPPLRITFSAPPTLGSSGLIQVFNAAQPSVAVASVNMSVMRTTETIGGVSFNLERGAYVEGNDAVIYLPGRSLSRGHSYHVHVGAGAIRGPGAAELAIADDTTWSFSTSASAPASASTLQVAVDGTGAFCSVQGAIDATGGDSSIEIGRGTYHGIVHFDAKDGLTLRGADRKATILTGINNENLNGGTAKRALIGIDRSDDLVIESLTIHNRTPQGGSQAEALRMQNCDRCIVRDADIISLQDTLLWSGRVYAHDCYIAGNVDFIWGTGTAYFDDCEIKTLGRKGLADLAGRHGQHPQCRQLI